MNLTDSVNLLIANPFMLIVMVIGAYGWWRLFARDTILDPIRNWIWSRFPHEGFTTAIDAERPPRGEFMYGGGSWYCTKGTKIGELIYCPFCLSWWVGVVFFGMFTIWPTFTLGTAILQASRMVTAALANRVG